MRYLITVSIVLYNNDRAVIRQAINSALNTGLDVQLFLIDNSPANSLRNISSDARVTYTHNPSNPGFGAAHNIALCKAIEMDAKYHLVLNPDIYYEAGALEKIVNFMDNNPKVGHLMPKVLYPDQSLQYLCKTNPTFFDLFARGFLPQVLKKLLRKRLDRYEYREHSYDKPIYDVPYLSGCFMFFRCSTMKEVGFFDDRIFMYLEDADITRRFLEKSRTVYYPFAQVYHYYEGLTHKQWKFKWITIQSAITYFNKWGWLKHII